VAFDEAGAYSPLFSRNNNMVYFIVTFAGAQNPKITFFNDFFFYEYEQGSFRPNDPGQIVQLEVPAGTGPNDKLTFNWFADPARDRSGNLIGGPIRSYRWAVDITNLEDETPRSNEETDLAHWSQKSVLVTSCRIPGGSDYYPGGQTHKFYLEADDINGLISLGTIQFTTVRATFAKPLLIVDEPARAGQAQHRTMRPGLDLEPAVRQLAGCGRTRHVPLRGAAWHVPSEPQHAGDLPRLRVRHAGRCLRIRT
jgi:hypothetical protein